MDGVDTTVNRTIPGITADPKKPVLLIYANCQADHMYKILSQVKSLIEDIDIKYLFIHSLEQPGCGWDSYSEDYMSGVTWVWEQVSDAFPAVRTELHRRLPASARRIRFPAFTAGMLWPFAASDRRPSTRQLYLYGDSVAAKLGNRVAGQRLSDANIFDQYMELSCRMLSDVDRVRELEVAAWLRRDLESDICITNYLINSFERIQLFFGPTRVTEYLVRYTMQKLLQETFNPSEEYLKTLECFMKYYVGYDNISLPIHPMVAERLNLGWFDPEARYRWFAHDWTFQEWIVRCVRLSPYVATLY